MVFEASVPATGWGAVCEAGGLAGSCAVPRRRIVRVLFPVAGWPWEDMDTLGSVW